MKVFKRTFLPVLLLSAQVVVSAATLPGPQDFETLSSGNLSLEGPSWNALDGSVIFTDQSGFKLLQWDADDGVNVLRSYAGKINGTTFDAQGRLLLCESSLRRINRITIDGDTLTDEVLVDGLANEPNDIIVHSNGTIWFTTPHFGGTSTDFSKQSVFRYDPELQQLEVVYTSTGKPNGLAFSPDETYLYVVLYSTNRIMRIPLSAAGEPSGSVTLLTSDIKSGPDGMKVDSDGNLYVVASSSDDRGVIVFDPQGNRIGLIRLPENSANPTNLTFSTDALIATNGSQLVRAPYAGFPASPHASFAQSSDSIVIDGEMDLQWTFVEPLNLRHPVPLFDALDKNDLITNPLDLAAEVRVLWDSENLYFLASVTDDNPQAPYTGTWYREDTVELYLDADRANAPADGLYDGLNDWELGFHSIATPVPIITGPNSVTDTSGFIATTKLFLGGYALEVKMPWSTLGLDAAPLDGHGIGIDFHVVDNDNQTGSREHKLAWFTAVDESWRDSRLFGEAVLNSASALAVYTGFPSPMNETQGASEGGYWIHGRRSNSDWLWINADAFPWAYHVDEGWMYFHVVTDDLIYTWAYDTAEWVKF